MMAEAALPTAPQPPKRRFYVITLLLALGLGYGALSIVLDHRHLASSAIAVEGRMTGGYREVTSRGVASTYPTVSFRTAEGRVVVGPVADAIDRSEIQPGRTVRLRYDPADPSIVRLADALAGGPGALPWILGGLALMVATPSVWGLVTGRPLRLKF